MIDFCYFSRWVFDNSLYILMDKVGRKNYSVIFWIVKEFLYFFISKNFFYNVFFGTQLPLGELFL